MNSPGIVENLIDLWNILNSFSLCMEEKDKIVWKDGVDLSFTVKGCYEFLSSSFIPFGSVNIFDKEYTYTWKMHVPLKIKTFIWRCFIKRLPTKDSFVYQGILSNTSDISCVFYGVVPEFSYHSLFLCHVAVLFWKEVAVELILCSSKRLIFWIVF